MNINILRYSLFGIAGGQEVDHTFVKFTIRFVERNSRPGYKKIIGLLKKA